MDYDTLALYSEVKHELELVTKNFAYTTRYHNSKMIDISLDSGQRKLWMYLGYTQKQMINCIDYLNENLEMVEFIINGG